MSNFDLQDKTVFITGATRGIGAAITSEFLSLGAQVIGTGTKKIQTLIYIGIIKQILVS